MLHHKNFLMSALILVFISLSAAITTTNFDFTQFTEDDADGEIDIINSSYTTADGIHDGSLNELYTTSIRPVKGDAFIKFSAEMISHNSYAAGFYTGLTDGDYGDEGVSNRAEIGWEYCPGCGSGVFYNDINGDSRNIIFQPNEDQKYYYTLRLDRSESEITGTAYSDSERTNQVGQDIVNYTVSVDYDHLHAIQSVDNSEDTNDYLTGQISNLKMDTAAVEINWNDTSSSEDGFYIYSNSSGSMNRIGNAGSNQESFIHNAQNLDFDDYICYEVTAYNEGGESDPTRGCININEKI